MNLSFHRASSILILCFVLSSVGLTHAAPQAPGEQPKWRTIHSALGFSVDLPGVPTKETHPITIGPMVVWPTRYQLIDTGAARLYIVRTFGFSPQQVVQQTPDELLDAAAEAFAKAEQLSLLDSQDFRTQSIRGRAETWVTPGNNYIHVRRFLAGERYVELVSGAKERTPPEDAKRFLLSFKPTKEPAHIAWSSFTAADGGFRVLLPSPPEEFLTSLSTPEGVESFPCVSAAVGDRLLVEVSRIHLPAGSTLPDMPERWLDLARDGGLAALRRAPATTLNNVEEQRVQIQGHPGRSIKFRTTTPISGKLTPVVRHHRLQFVVVGRRIYHLTAVTNGGTEEVAAANKFIASFQLLVKATPAR